MSGECTTRLSRQSPSRGFGTAPGGGVRFTGCVHAMPEGTPFFANAAGLLLPRMVGRIAKLVIAHAGRIFKTRAIQNDSTIAEQRSEGRIRYGRVRAGLRVDNHITGLTGAGIRHEVLHRSDSRAGRALDDRAR